MWCKTCGYQVHEGCCEECVGHTTDGQCVTEELLIGEPAEPMPILHLDVAS